MLNHRGDAAVFTWYYLTIPLEIVALMFMSSRTISVVRFLSVLELWFYIPGQF